MPGSTCRVPAPPIVTSRGTPAWTTPATRCLLSARNGLIGSDPSRGGAIAETATSCPAANAATVSTSVASAATTVSPGISGFDPSRLTAVTSCPRESASAMMRDPAIPLAPYTMIFNDLPELDGPPRRSPASRTHSPAPNDQALLKLCCTACAGRRLQAGGGNSSPAGGSRGPVALAPDMQEPGTGVGGAVAAFLDLCAYVAGVGDVGQEGPEGGGTA